MERKYDIIWLDSVDSTNNEALRRSCQHDGMSVIAAIEQTSGRGQRGNTWKSDGGLNLTFSIAIPFGKDGIPEFPAIRQFLISKATALSITDFLEDYGIQARIKWPNDIYAADRKICGILIENSLSGDRLKTAVIGIGLNVNQEKFPSDLPNPTSMAIETGRKHVDLQNLLTKYIAYFDRRFEEGLQAIKHRNADGIDSLSANYFDRLYGNGKFLKYRDVANGKYFVAKIHEVAETGILTLEDETGSRRQFNFKEIELILE